MEVYDPPNRTGKCNSLWSTRRQTEFPSSRPDSVQIRGAKDARRVLPSSSSRAQWHEESGANQPTSTNRVPVPRVQGIPHRQVVLLNGTQGGWRVNIFRLL
jgi:hypothetical protein